MIGRPRHAAAILAVVLGLAELALVVATCVEAVHRPELFAPGRDRFNAVLGIIGDGVGEVLVGMVVAARRPRNPIGWLLLGFGAVTGASTTLGAVAQAGFEPGVHASLGARVALVVSNAVLDVPIVVILTMIVALFPAGRVQPGWRRRLLWPYGGVCAIGLPAIVLSPTLSDNDGRHHLNPIHWARTAPLDAGTVYHATLFVVILVAVVIVVDAVARGFRARGVERAQAKLFGYAAVAMFVFVGATILLPASSLANNICWLIGSNTLAVAIGVAVLRYRLYDLDRIVSRTLSYALLTGLLVGLYIGTVTLATRVLPFSSPVAVAVSTLAAVALFNPLRRRIQRLVDRRFNRARYDAEFTAASFASVVGKEAGLDVIIGELLAVVDATLQPAHASLWLTGGQRELAP